MELNTQSGNSLSVADSVFGVEFKESLIHQVVVAYLAGGRAGTKAQKNRSAVSGGGRKPFRQKGTGRARQGTIRSPLMRKGGVTFAAQPRDYRQKVNKKMYRAAMRSILSELVRQERLIVVDEFSLEQPKTKLLAQKLKDMGLDDVLIITEEQDEHLILASRNLIKVAVDHAQAIDPVSLIKSEKVLMTTGALKKIEERLA